MNTSVIQPINAPHKRDDPTTVMILSFGVFLIIVSILLFRIR